MKYKFLRFKINFRRWIQSFFNTAEFNLSPEQEKSIRIAKKLIIDADSLLYSDSVKSRYIIVNGDRYVRITTNKIRIINGVYKYDISFDERQLYKVISYFKRNMEHRLDNIETDIDSRVEKSLDLILQDIENEKRKIII